jgi:hypothetical protein
LKAILERENAMVTYFENILQRGVDRGIFRIKDPFLTANIIVYLLALEPLRGWNLKKRYQVKEIHEYLTDFILDRVLKGSLRRKYGFKTSRLSQEPQVRRRHP